MGGNQEKRSLYMVGRGVLTALFYNPLPILPPPFQILSNLPSPTSLSPPTPNPIVLSVVLFLCLNGWSCHIWCAILLNDNMDLHMSSFGTLVPEGPWCVFYATRHKVYWGLKHNVFFTGTLIWYHTHQQTNTHNKLRGQ